MEPIDKLSQLQTEVNLMEKFKGKAALVRSIGKDISYLTRFRTEGENVGELLYKERLKDLKRLGQDKVQTKLF